MKIIEKKTERQRYRKPLKKVWINMMYCIESSRQKVYLTSHEVLYVHEQLLLRYGGAKGVVNPDGINSAVARACSGYYAELKEEAAALVESLLINHPFRDGNKRTAFACADVFLRLNGLCIKGSDQVLLEMVYTWLAVPSPKRFARILKDLEALLNGT